MKIAIDFDGTIVDHRYPSIGKEKPLAVETVKQLIADGHKVILWTVRSGDLLEDAVQWCERKGIQFYAVNNNYPKGGMFDSVKGDSPKVDADLFIDDSNLGGLPDWEDIYDMINNKLQSRGKRNKSKSFMKRLFGK